MKKGYNPSIYIDLTLEKNTDYTFSYNTDYARYYIYKVNENGSTTILKTVTQGSDVYTFNTSDHEHFKIGINTWSQNVDKDRRVWEIMLGKGNKQADWSPALEDTDEILTRHETEITENKEGISSTVKYEQFNKSNKTLERLMTELNQTNSGLDFTIDSNGVIQGFNLNKDKFRFDSQMIEFNDGDVIIKDGVTTIKQAWIDKLGADEGFINRFVSQDAFINNAEVTTLVSKNHSDRFTLEAGQMNWQRSNGSSMELGLDGIYMKNPDGATRFQVSEQMVTSAALGTSNANVYLGATYGYEVRFVERDSLPSDGLASSYTYVNARGKYGYFDAVAPNQGTHLWLGADREVRISNKGFSTYNVLRAAGLYADFVEQNTLGSSGSNFYIRPRKDGEVRFTEAGSTSKYINVRLNRLSLESSYGIANNSGADFYIGTGGKDLLITNNSFYNNGNPSYQNVRANGFYGEFAETTASNFYVRASNEIRFTAKGSISSYRDIVAKSVYYTDSFAYRSTEKSKKDIELWDINASEIIEELPFYKYRYKNNTDGDLHHGVIIERGVPEFWLGKNNENVKLNEVIYTFGKSLQEQIQLNKKLKKRIEVLEKQLLKGA